MTNTVLGPITLHDRDKNSEKTAPQVRTIGSSDSRLFPSYYPLHTHQIRCLRDDPTIELARWAVLSPMIHTPWVYTNNNGQASKEMLDFLEINFSPIRDWFLCQSVFGTLDYGWQPFEVVYKPEDGQIFIDWFKPLLQDLTTILVYIETGRFAGYLNNTQFVSSGRVGETKLLEKYAMNINFEVEGTDWYGRSVFRILRNVLKSWDTVESAAHKYDKKIAGATWVVYYPVGKTLHNGVYRSNDEIAQEVLSTLEASGGVAIPDEIQEWLDDTIDKEAKGKWRLEILSASGNSSVSMTDRQKYLDALKIRAFGLTERSLLEGKHGTKEEADVHGDVALSIVDTRHRLICTQLNCGPVPHVMEMNFGKKYRYAASIWPAPLVDAEFSTVKSIYDRILSDGDVLAEEVKHIDIKSLRDKVGIQTGTGLTVVKERVESPLVGRLGNRKKVERTNA